MPEPDDGPAYFFSDLHLHGGDAEGVRRACRFVDWACERGARGLYLLGDVFRAWRGARSLDDPGLQPFLETLSRASADGVRVLMVHGNHDFLAGEHLHRALGVEVPGTDAEIELGGRRVLLTHGDRFCTRDRSYHRLHAVIRSSAFRLLFRVLPDALFDRLERALLSGSRHQRLRKSDDVMAIVDAEVERVMRGGPELVVCGHVHRARDAELCGEGGRGRLVVLADFETTGSHAEWRDGRLRLHAEDARFTDAAVEVVTIDGPAGSGKSSVSRALAGRLGFGLLDSGALYRALTAKVVREGLDLDGAPADALERLAERTRLEVEPDGGVSMDGTRVRDADLRGPEVTALVSRVSADPGLRAAVLPVQLRAAARGGLVAEGRDMATVVFPCARYRFYLDARPEVRAARRLAQRPDAGAGAAEVERRLRERDRSDASRAHAPLRAAAGAELVDNSDLSLEATVDELVRRIDAQRARLGVPVHARGIAPEARRVESPRSVSSRDS